MFLSLGSRRRYALISESYQQAACLSVCRHSFDNGTIWGITGYEHSSTTNYLTSRLSTCWQHNTNLAAALTCKVGMTTVLFKVQNLQTFHSDTRLFHNLRFQFRCVCSESVNISIKTLPDILFDNIWSPNVGGEPLAIVLHILGVPDSNFSLEIGKS